MVVKLVKEVIKSTQKGHISKRLLLRLGLLLGLSTYFFMSGITKFIKLNLHVNIILMLIIFGFCIGYFVFSRMNRISWHEEKKIVYTTKLDIIDIILLIVYVIFEILIKVFLEDIYPNANVASAYSTITIAALILGRIFSMFQDIQTVNKHIKNK